MQGEIVSGKNMFAKTKLGKNMTEEHKSEKNKSNQRKSEKNSSEKTKLRNKEYSLQKNDLIMLEITDLTEEGQGVGKKDGLVFFVKDSVMGDLVEARILKAKKNYAYAKVEKLLEASPYRIIPLCPVAGKCGGCQLQHLSYEKELAWKEDRIAQSLIRIAGLSPEEVESKKEGILGGVLSRYRNKAQYPVQSRKEIHSGKVVDTSASSSALSMGFYGFHSHRIIETKDCLINSVENPLILNCIKDWAREYKISGYEEETGKGLLRHIFLRKGFSTGEILICFVINGRSLAHGNELWERLQGLSLNDEEGSLQSRADMQCDVDTQSRAELHCGVDTQSEADGHCEENRKIQEKIVGLCVNINEGSGNAILGRETLCLYGKDSIEDKIGELSFSISVPSFYQVNPTQTEKIYGKALEYAALTGEETVWDCYCGIGTISLFLAQKAKQVYGLEIVPEAIENAKKNAEKNGLHNTEFFVGAAEEVLPKWVEEQKREGKDVGNLVDVVSLDPPRKGCDEACLSAVLELSPKRIVYVSCDPGSLARDIKYLGEGGYKLEKWVGIDNFPRTGHVETIALLQKEES